MMDVVRYPKVQAIQRLAASREFLESGAHNNKYSSPEESVQDGGPRHEGGSVTSPKGTGRIAGGRAPHGTPESSRKTWRREHHRYRNDSEKPPRRGWRRR